MRLLALLLLPASLAAQELPVALTVTSILTTVADVELTQRCLQRGECREGNPLLPTKRWKVYAVQVPLTLGLNYLAYRWKKKRVWWVPQVSLIVGHGVGVSFGLRWTGGR